MNKKTKISIDYRKCGDGTGVDPRDCCKCLRVCKPAIFLLHQTIGAEQKDPYNPEKKRISFDASAREFWNTGMTENCQVGV